MVEKQSHKTLEGALALLCCFVSSNYSNSNELGGTLLSSMA